MKSLKLICLLIVSPVVLAQFVKPVIPAANQMKCFKKTCKLAGRYACRDSSDERKMFANNSQDYLITKIQRNRFTGLKSGSNTVELNLMHPIKELIWVLQKNVTNGNNYENNYTLY